MSKRLRDVIAEFLTREGESVGKAKLQVASGRGEPTIRRWLKMGFPTSNDAYIAALTCGCTDAEALALAKEEFASDAAKESA